MIDHFLYYPKINNTKSFLSYNYELDLHTLYALHGLTDVDTYIQRMHLSTTSTTSCNEVGLWGDIFCIKWLSKWLNIQVSVWSSTRKSKYLHFNNASDRHAYSILFHDQDPLHGHFEPLIHKHQFPFPQGTNFSTNPPMPHAPTNPSLKASQASQYSFYTNVSSISNCGDSLFNAIASLTNGEFDSHSLR